MTSPLRVSSLVMRALLAAALIVASCGGTPPTSAPSDRPSVLSSPSPNLIDLMMGALPEATAFVVSGREVLAVTLLNHFVRYRIPVADEPRLATSPDGSRLYVVDRVGAELRFRRFDVLTGALGADRLVPVNGRSVIATDGPRGALAADAERLLLLREASPGLLVHEYDALTLAPRGTPAKNDGCARRILAAAAEYALLCSTGGPLYVFWPDGASQGGGIARVWGPLAGAAISSEGTIATAHAFGDLHLVRRRTSSAERLEPRGWTKAPVALDGIAWADPFTLVIVEAGTSLPGARIKIVNTLTFAVRAFDLPNVPVDGILASGAFAYWVAGDASGMYHIDLESGLVERMFGPLDKGARLGALAVR